MEPSLQASTMLGTSIRTRNEEYLVKSIYRQTLLATAILLMAANVTEAAKPPTILRTPDRGIQPQAVVDSKGVLHLIYFKGDPGNGDIFYVRRDPGQERFSSPIQVNSQAGSAIATGTIRGAQIALGK